MSYYTAWSLKHRPMQVMKERDDTRPLGGWVQLDDAYWGGERRGGKRGRGAPGKTPFVAAVEFNREGRPVRMRLSRVGAFQSDEVAAVEVRMKSDSSCVVLVVGSTWRDEHASKETTMTREQKIIRTKVGLLELAKQPGNVVLSDALGCFSAVQRAGCFHQLFATGSGPTSAQHPALSWVNAILGNIKRSLHGRYHPVSFKHLPRYRAEFYYRFNHRFSLREMFPRLAYVALRTPPIPNRVLKLAEDYA